MKRAVLILLALLVALPIAIVAGGGILLDTQFVRARLAAAVEQATGRHLRIDGPIRLAWSLAPQIEANDVALVNPPGFAAKTFASVQRIAARVPLRPLLSGRVEIQSVTLDRLDIRLERNAAGRGNWLPAEPAQSAFPPQSAAAQSAAAPSAAPPSSPASPIQVARVSINDARIQYGAAPPVAIPSLSFSPAGGPVEGQVLVNAAAFAVNGETGPLAAASTPFKLSVVGAGLAASAEGSLGAGIGLSVLVPDAAALQPVFGRPVPPIHGIAFEARIAQAGLESLRLRALAADLAAIRPGLRLRALAADAPAPGQPLSITAEGDVHALPFSLALNVGQLSTLLDGAPIHFQAFGLADGAALSAQGQLAALSAANVSLAVAGKIPDLRRTARLAGFALPPLTNLAIEALAARAQAQPGLSIPNFHIASDQGDLSGDIALVAAPRPSIRANLASQRLDLDALLQPDPSPPPSAPPAQPAAPAPGALAGAPSPNVLDRPLPFAALRLADADIRLAVAQARLKAADYRAIEAHLSLQGGKLRLDPANAAVPGGPFRAQLSADANPSPPTAVVALQAPKLQAGPLAEAFGAPDILAGDLLLDIHLEAAGSTLRAMLPTFQGHAGAALVDGKLQNQALSNAFGSILRAINLSIDAGGVSLIRCLVLDADIGAGQAKVNSFALDASQLQLQADGAVNLLDQTLDLRVRPVIRVGGVNVGAPVRLQGPFAAPTPSLERNAANGRFGFTLSQSSADVCGPALAAARR